MILEQVFLFTINIRTDVQNKCSTITQNVCSTKRTHEDSYEIVLAGQARTGIDC